MWQFYLKKIIRGTFKCQNLIYNMKRVCIICHLTLYGIPSSLILFLRPEVWEALNRQKLQLRHQTSVKLGESHLLMVHCDNCLKHDILLTTCSLFILIKLSVSLSIQTAFVWLLHMCYLILFIVHFNQDVWIQEYRNQSYASSWL